VKGNSKLKAMLLPPNTLPVPRANRAGQSFGKIKGQGGKPADAAVPSPFGLQAVERVIAFLRLCSRLQHKSNQASLPPAKLTLSWSMPERKRIKKKNHPCGSR